MYRVYRCDILAGCLPIVVVLTPATSAFSNTGLTPDTSYTYAVSALDALGNESQKSNPLLISTSIPLGDSVAPTIPANCAAVSDASDQITVTCDPSTDNIGVLGYVTQRCPGVGCTPGVQVDNTATSTHISRNLSPATTYGFRMAAFDAAWNFSGVSTTVSALTPAAPTVPKMVLLLNNDFQDSAGGDRDGVGTSVTFTTNTAQRAEGSHAAVFDAATDAVTLPLAHPIADGLNGLPMVDNCNRTESPLSHGGQWTTDVLLADASTMTANGSACLRSATAGDGSAWWNVQTFDPDMAISAVMPDATLPSSGAPFLYVRLTQPGVVN
jgi:hypothetical protein